MLRRPAARRMESSICTVVVLPLVPVTQSHGVSWSGSRSRHASSTSPQTGIPRAVAWASSGAVGFQPGEVTSTSTSSGRVAVAPSPRRTSAPSTSSSSAFSGRSPASDSSSATTLAPRWLRLSAAAKPDTPNPATTAFTPSQESWRPRSAAFMTRSSQPCDPLGVEDAETAGDAEPGDDPEADHDRDLLPAEQLEVVLQRRHPEDPVPRLHAEDLAHQARSPGELEEADLHHHR